MTRKDIAFGDAFTFRGWSSIPFIKDSGAAGRIDDGTVSIAMAPTLFGIPAST